MRKRLSGAAAIAVVVLLAMAGVWLFHGGSHTAQADPTIDILIDAVPSEPVCGPIVPANVETCVRVESVEAGLYPGPVFDVDVLMDNTAAGDALDGFNYNLNFPGIGPLPNGVTGWSHVTKFLNCFPDSAPVDNSNGGVAPPLGISPLYASAGDGALGKAETNPMYVSGVLGTYTLDVTGLAAGLYPLSVDTVALGDDGGVRCGFIADLQDRDCDMVNDDPVNTQGAIVAVDQACPTPADLEKVDLTASGLPANTKGGSEPDVDVCDNVPFTLTETLANNGTIAVVAKITTTCTSPTSTPDSMCSYVPDKANDSPDGDLEVSGPTIGDLTNPTDGEKIEDTWLTVVQRISVATGAPTVMDKSWDLHCGEPSTHTWSFENTIEPDDPGTNPDPTPGNNGPISLDITVECWAEADVSFTQQVFEANCSDAAPTEIPQGTDYDVCVRKTITQTGYTGDVEVTRSHSGTPPGGGCSVAFKSGPLTTTVSGGSGIMDEIWTIRCPDTGGPWTWTFSNRLDISTPHVSDPDDPPGDPDDPDATASANLTLNVTATADADIEDWQFPDELGVSDNQFLVVTGTPRDLLTTETLMNNDGSYQGTEIDVSIDATAAVSFGDCTRTPSGSAPPTSTTLQMDGTPEEHSHTWQVTLNSGTYCTIDFDKTIDITTSGVGDEAPGNNNWSESVDVVKDTDGDTVPDDYDTTVDNCVDVANPTQTDTDGDCATGDPSNCGNACDPDDDNDTELDLTDNCPLVPNADQANSDNDSHGDACDNCPDDDNEDQADSDGDGIGDVCEPPPPPPGVTPTPTPTAEATPEEGTPEVVETPEATPTAIPTPGEICAPVFPGTYNGTIRLDGVPAPDGTVIKALIGDTEWASTTVLGGLYTLDIPETLPTYAPCFEGGTITFAVEGYVCSPSPDWASGLHSVDVSCEVAPIPAEPTPEVTPTPGVTPTPVAPPPTGGRGLLDGGSAPWAAAVAAAGVLALVLAAAGLSYRVRGRLR